MFGQLGAENGLYKIDWLSREATRQIHQSSVTQSSRRTTYLLEEVGQRRVFLLVDLEALLVGFLIRIAEREAFLTHRLRICQCVGV